MSRTACKLDLNPPWILRHRPRPCQTVKRAAIFTCSQTREVQPNLPASFALFIAGFTSLWTQYCISAVCCIAFHLYWGEMIRRYFHVVHCYFRTVCTTVLLCGGCCTILQYKLASPRPSWTTGTARDGDRSFDDSARLHLQYPMVAITLRTEDSSTPRYAAHFSIRVHRHAPHPQLGPLT